MKTIFEIILSWLVPLLTPLVLLGLSLRLLLMPFYLTMEYNLPGFPPDIYGFTTADRLTYAPYALDYLVNSEDISYLARLTFPDGNPLFNERELSHMEDVKMVTQGGLQVWYSALLLLLLLWFFAWQANSLQAYLDGLRRGGWLMMGLAAAVGLFAAAAFWEFFTYFHALFFEGDTWLFYYSDTLIRLFPMRFWQDAFLWAGIIVLGCALALALGLRNAALGVKDSV